MCVTGRTLRNLTYDAVLAGKYLNIRMHSVPHNNQPDGGFNGTDLDICEPTRPQLAKQPGTDPPASLPSPPPVRTHAHAHEHK